MVYKQKYGFVKIILPIFGAIFIIVSLSDFLEGDYFYAFVVFSIGLLLIYPSFKKRVNFVIFNKRFFSYYFIIFIVFLIFTNFNKSLLYAFLTIIIIANIPYIAENKYGKKFVKQYASFETIQKSP